MTNYVIKRLLLFIPTLFLVSLVIFFIMRIIPGDLALMILAGPTGEGNYTQEDLERVQAMIGTDQRLHIQYLKWAGGVFQGDFGQIFFYNVAVIDELKTRVPVTLELTVLAILIAFVVSVPLGVISAVKQDTWADYGAKLFTVAGVALPTFWVGILLVLFLSRVFGWLPPLGYAKLWEDPLKNLQQLIFPALALGYYNMAFTARITRSSMLEVLRDDYIRTARSKGLHEMMVIGRHALKNALMPVIAVSGWQFSRLLGGAVLIEIIFTVPGMGHMLVDSILHRDFNAVQAVILLVAAFVLFLNLLVDVINGWLDPRVRYA